MCRQQYFNHEVYEKTLKSDQLRHAIVSEAGFSKPEEIADRYCEYLRQNALGLQVHRENILSGPERKTATHDFRK